MTREEAIKILASSCIPGSKQTEALETLIPELAESEDEMIRKEIISALKFANDGGVYDKHIAYLERQKERKPSDLPAGFYFIDKDGNKYYSKEFRFNNGTFTTTMKVREEHKPSWSKEDEEMINVLVNYVKDPSCWYLRCPREKLVAFIESLPERFNLEPKQEWSEEDERMLSRCIKSIETSKQFADSATFKRAKDNEIDWLTNKLKSLSLI